MKNPGVRKAWIWSVVVFGLTALHFGLVIRHFPPSVASPENPLCSGDFHWHFARSLEGREVLRHGSLLWGYSPNYMAGYPYGVWGGVSGRGYAWAASLLPMIPVSACFYIYVLVTAVLPPFLIAAAAWTLGLRWRDIGYSFAAGVLIYHFDNLVSYFWTLGNVAFPFVSSLGVLWACILVAGFERRRWCLTLGGGVILAVIGYLHPLVVFPLLVTAAAACLVYRRSLLSWRGVLHPILLCIVAAVLLTPRVVLLFRFADTRLLRESPALTSGVKCLVMDLMSDRAYGHPFDRRFVFQAQLVLVALGAYWTWRRRERGMAVLLAGAAASFLFAYLFPYCAGLKKSEPYRYLVAFSMFAAIPAARGFQDGIWLLRGSNRSGRLVALCLSLMLLPALGGHCLDIVQRAPARGLRDQPLAVIAWLRKTGIPAGRTTCEDIALGNMLRYHTGATVIGGGISSSASLQHSYTALSPQRAGAMQVDKLSTEYLQGFLDRYNVRTVIVHNARFRCLLGAMEGFRQTFSAGPYAVFVANRPGSWIFGGVSEADTVVKAGPNEIYVERAPAGEFVLKYHYLSTLRASDVRIALFPVAKGDDPVPFIGVRSPRGVETIQIRNRVEWWRGSGGGERE